MKVSVNGEIREQKDALISIADKAVWYDFGVYENIKVLQGKVMWPLPHVDRLFRSAQLIGLTLGEDKETVLSWIAAHACGAEYKNKKVGNFADLTEFSFHPVKHITTGEGGMVTTDNKELYEKLNY